MVVTSKRPDTLVDPGRDPFDARAARVAALDTLARRDHPAEALRRKLLEKGYDPAVVADVLADLCAEKLVDDRRYVENFIGFRAARGQGPLRVGADLRQMGLSDELVKNGIEAFAEWMAHLRSARQKKFGATLPTDYADRQRQARFLGYRGFTGAQIRLVLGFDTDLDIDT